MDSKVRPSESVNRLDAGVGKGGAMVAILLPA